ncbi:MAG TPA: tetratricopeptide repeat protein [Candidatus Acidoferrum sp.]|nr:tetratricopeptide repeat protein [Candidatus Acidoferrum sp.]
MALLVCSPTVQAQDSRAEKADGAISGTVVSQGDHRPVGQVAISLKSHAAGIFRSILADIEGHFEVRGLPPGTYDVAVDEAGYEPVRTKVQLNGPSLKLVFYLTSSTPPQLRQKSYTVSVRELKIPNKAREQYQKGLDRLAKNDLAGSLSHFTKAAAAYPDFYEAFYHLGTVEMRLGRNDEAKQAFQKAIDLSGGRYAWAEFGYAYALYLEGKAEEAESMARKGLEMDQNSPDGHVILGMTLLRLDRPDEAEKSAREALLRNPNSAEAYLILSDVYGRRRNYREQLQDLDVYLKLDPTGPASQRVHQAREATMRLLAESRPR